MHINVQASFISVYIVYFYSTVYAENKSNFDLKKIIHCIELYMAIETVEIY